MNKRLVYAVLAAALASALCGCRREDRRPFTVSIPQMEERDRAAIAGALAPYGGVDRRSLSFDFAKKTLSLEYDSMQVAKKNIEMAIAAAGFEANGVTPESIGAAPARKAGGNGR